MKLRFFLLVAMLLVSFLFVDFAYAARFGNVQCDNNFNVTGGVSLPANSINEPMMDWGTSADQINLDNLTDNTYAKILATQLTGGSHILATTAVKGIASFSTTYFTVTAGVVTLNTIPVVKGGTGLTAFTQYAILYADTTTSLAQIGIGTAGQCLVVNGGATGYAYADFSGSDNKVGVDAAATAGYLGAAYNDGVLRTDGTILTVTDGGDFITLGLADAVADDSTKGVATFETDDFDATTGKIDLKATVVKSVATDGTAATPAVHSFGIKGAGIAVTSGAGTDVTITATEVDGSTTNEINTITADDAGITSGLAITVAGGGINATTRAGDTITVTATEAQTLDAVLALGATSSTNVLLNGEVQGDLLNDKFSYDLSGTYLSLFTTVRLLLPWITPATTEIDLSSLENNATYVGTMTTADQIKKGLVYVLDFDGTDDYLSVVDDDVFTYGGSKVSFAGWFEVVADAAEKTILSKWDEKTGTELREYKLVLDADEKLAITFYDETENASITSTSNDALSAGFHYIVVTHDGTTALNTGFNMYVDGVAVDETGSAVGTYITMENTATEVKIGAIVGTDTNPGNFFPGDMGQVVITQEELSAFDIWKSYIKTRAYIGL